MTVKEAAKYIAGITVSNDVSNRFWQRRNVGTWGFGKGFDGFCPIGPCIATLDGLARLGKYNSETGSLDVKLTTAVS